MSRELRETLRRCRKLKDSWLGGYCWDRFRVLTIWNGNARIAKFQLSWPAYRDAIGYWGDLGLPKTVQAWRSKRAA